MRARKFLTLFVLLNAVPVLGGGASDARREFQAVLSRTPDVERGAQLFETCAACHGRDGGGVSDGTVPAIAGQHYRVIVKQLVDFRHDRRWDIRMEHFVDRHRLPEPQQLADLASFVSQMQRTSHPGRVDPELLGRGASVYFVQCESCHGPIGEGDADDVVPRLAGQHSDYLIRQFYDAVEGRRPNMDGEHARRLAKLDRDEIVGIADYLSRLTPSPEKAGMTGDL
ncbi:MAG: c-type cytochrome [Steroidobacteraceae bacterium]